MKILFVTYNMPYPRTAGSCQRTALLIEALRKRHQLDLFLLRGKEQADFLLQNGYAVAGYTEIPVARTLRKVWIRLFRHIRHEYRCDLSVFKKVYDTFKAGNYDFAIGRYLKASQIAGISSLPQSIVDIDDVDTSVLDSRLNARSTPTWKKPLIRWKARQLHSVFDSLVEPYSRCWISSANDLELLHRADVDVVANIPWKIPEVAYKPSSEAKQILWVGSFNHQVNLIGIDRFIDVTWPHIYKNDSDAVLRIVGSSLPKKYRTKWSKRAGVDVLGFVENLNELYASCAFSIVPLWDGAGTKIKVLESLSYGRTVLLTTHSIRGFEKNLRHGDALWVADNDEELVEGALGLLSNPYLRRKLEFKGFQQVNRHHSIESFQLQVDESLSHIKRRKSDTT